MFHWSLMSLLSKTISNQYRFKLLIDSSYNATRSISINNYFVFGIFKIDITVVLQQTLRPMASFCVRYLWYLFHSWVIMHDIDSIVVIQPMSILLFCVRYRWYLIHTRINVVFVIFVRYRQYELHYYVIRVHVWHSSDLIIYSCTCTSLKIVFR